MKVRVFRFREEALTLPEVLLVLGLLVILAGLLLPALAVRRKSSRHNHYRCVSNLRQVGLAMRMFHYDHNRQFPWNVPVSEGGSKEYANTPEVFRHYLVASNELNSPKMLACFADTNRVRAAGWDSFSNSNLSYFVGLEADEGKPRTILAGDRSLLINNRIVTGPVTATRNDSVSIRDGFHPGVITIAFGDGSAQQLSADELRQVMEKENELPLRFVIP